MLRKEEETVNDWRLIYKGNIEQETTEIRIDKMLDGSNFSFKEIIYKIKPVVDTTGVLMTLNMKNIQISTYETSSSTARPFFGHLCINPLGCEGIFVSKNSNGGVQSEEPLYINDYTLFSDKEFTYISFRNTSYKAVFTTDTEIEIYGR